MEPKRILIIQTAFIGDVILTTPLVKNLKQIFPHSHLSFLLIPETKNCLENNPHLNEIVVYDKRKKWGIFEFLRKLGEVRWRDFDLVVIPHRSLRSALLAYMAGIKQRIGFDRSTGSVLLTRKITYLNNIHEVDRNLSLLSDLSSNLRDTSPELFPSSEDYDYVRRLLDESGIRENDKLVCISPGSIWPTKRWLLKRFAEVAQLFLDKAGVKVIFLGSDDDRKLCQNIGDLMKEKPPVLAGKTNILQSAAIISMSKVVLSNDSAPVHMASAMKKPVVAIFGSTVPEFGFGPYGVDHLIIQKKMDCRPCGIHGKKRCPQKHFRCMREITTEEVFRAVSSFL
jgi:heptosyltransferase-2